MLLHLLLNLLLLYELRVGVLQLVVQAGVFVWTRLPDWTLSTTITEQSLDRDIQSAAHHLPYQHLLWDFQDVFVVLRTRNFRCLHGGVNVMDLRKVS